MDEFRTFLDESTGQYFVSTLADIQQMYENGQCWIDPANHIFATDDGFECYVVQTIF